MRLWERVQRSTAPYVLLRSLQQWRCREAITLPADVRGILEATYAEPDAAEPESWRQLREDLEKRKQALADTALSATNVWSQPALPDDEGVQTRYSNYPTASLFVVHGVETLDARTVRLHLLDGTHVEAGAMDWDFDAAKSIHRNLARLPKWAVAAALAKPAGLVDQSRPAAGRGGPAPPDGARWLARERDRNRALLSRRSRLHHQARGRDAQTAGGF